jgi:hypothetical protein
VTVEGWEPDWEPDVPDGSGRPRLSPVADALSQAWPQMPADEIGGKSVTTDQEVRRVLASPMEELGRVTSGSHGEDQAHDK